MQNFSETAMLFAAGLGTRLRPLTLTTPKPLVQVSGRAIIDYALDSIAESGIKNALVNTHYLPEKITEHLQNRSALAPKIKITYEAELLDTGGTLAANIAQFGALPFFSINGDVIWRGDPFNTMRSAWNDEIMDALLWLQPCESAIGYYGNGDFSMNDQRQIISGKKGESAPYVFTGLQLLSPRLFADAPQGTFSMRVFYDRAKNSKSGVLSRIYGIFCPCDWLHIGDQKGLAEAEEFFLR